MAYALVNMQVVISARFTRREQREIERAARKSRMRRSTFVRAIILEGVARRQEKKGETTMRTTDST